MAASPRLQNLMPRRKTLLGRRNGCGRRILAVEVVDERPRDVDAVGRIDDRDLAAIDDYVNSALLGKSFEALLDIVFQGCKNLAAPLGVSSLRILTLALELLIPLLELVDFRLQCSRFSNTLGLINLILELLDLLLRVAVTQSGAAETRGSKLLSTVVESGDAGLGIQKRIRINKSDLALW